MLDETQISRLSAAELRLYEAVYFYQRFRDACGPPKDSYFAMISLFDAFLFVLISIEEMVSPSDKNRLHSSDVFKFFKAARNVTTHHSVLAAPNQSGGFVRPFSRNIREVDGLGSAELRIDVAKLTAGFSVAAANFPRGANVFQAGITYLSNRLAPQIDLVAEMKDGLLAVKNAIGSNMVI
jgi:hypothetical protein